MRRFTLERLDKAATIKLALVAGAFFLWVTPIPRLGFSHQDVLPSFPVPQLLGGTAPDMSQVVSRPLFTQTRRPPPPVALAPAQAAAPVPTTNGMTLLGVLNTGTRSVALVSISGQSKPVMTAIGGTLGEWTVIAILPDRISLRTGGTTAILPLPASSMTAATSNSPPSLRNFQGFPSPP